MSEFFTNGTVELIVNGHSKGSVSTGGQNVGAFVREQAARYGLKSFSVYVDNNKFYTENAAQSLDGVSKVEIVAKDSRGGGTWETFDDDDAGDSFIPRTPTPKAQGAPKLKLTFDRKALIASKQATIDKAEAEYTAAVAEFDADQKLVKEFVDANAEVLAKKSGYKSVESFNEQYKDLLTQKLAQTLGFRTSKPFRPNLDLAKAHVATLSAAANDTIEVEEGHPFITHLNGR